mgnify:CR=1 FL=1
MTTVAFIDERGLTKSTVSFENCEFSTSICSGLCVDHIVVVSCVGEQPGRLLDRIVRAVHIARNRGRDAFVEVSHEGEVAVRDIEPGVDAVTVFRRTVIS